MPKCSKCHTEMYQASNGFHECRNFDCPPGTEAKYKQSWQLGYKYLPMLVKEPASKFTVEELGFILQGHHSGKEDGFRLRDLAIKLGLEVPRG